MNRLRRMPIWLFGAALILVLGASPGQADVLVDGVSGTLHATANFALSGSELTITLTNLGVSTGNATLLHGLFFDVTGSPTLAAGTANLAAGSKQIKFDGTDYPGPAQAAQGWGFEQGTTVSNVLSGVTYGIMSAGFGIGGNSNFTNSVVDQLDGTNWGIANGSATGANGGQSPQVLITNAMVFKLTGFTGTLADISGVTFQYGTALTDTRITPGGPGPELVPEPSTLFMGSVAGLFWLIA